jgi:hypothetical protein
MIAARKLNDMIAMTAVIEAVSSIGSSFPIGEAAANRLGRVGNLSVIANPSRTAPNALTQAPRR